MSQPHLVLTYNDLFWSQPSQVATSTSGRDLNPNLARSYPAQPGRDTHFWSQPQVGPQGFQPCRNLKIQVATFSRLNQVATSNRCHDLGPKNQVTCLVPTSWARAGALPVTTPNLGRDPTLEIGSSHSSFCLAQFFFFFQIPPVAFLPPLGSHSLKKKQKLLLLRCSSLTLQITINFSDLYSSQIKEFNYNSFFSCAKTGIIFQNSTKHNLFILKN